MAEYTIAKYLRLSSEDGDMKASAKNESNSIANQRNLIDSYISSHRDFDGASVIELCDDGWSGTNFDRPAMQNLLRMVKCGEIQCIIVKDISRFGRDYLTVGNYISQVFPFLGVRFIAINDGLDSVRTTDVDSLETSFKALLYDLYSRDLSRKIRSSLTIRAKQGFFLSPYAPYGYRKDPDNKNHLLVDPEPAEIVHRIFQMIGQGTTVVCVANQLNSEGVPTPSAYKKAAGIRASQPNQVGDVNFWQKATIYKIVRDEQYLGKTVYHRQVCDQVGRKHTVKVNQNDWIVVEDCHEPIVTQEEFDLAQNALRDFVNRKAHPSSNPLSRRVRCGVCGRILNRVSNKNAYYCCETPRYTDRYHCSTEHIMETALFDLILVELHTQATVAVEGGRVLEERRARISVDTSGVLKEITSLRETQERKRRQIKALYDAFILEGLDKAQYIAQKNAINQECDAIDIRLAELQTQLDTSSTKVENAFVSCFSRYQDIQQLTDDVVTDVIKEILVYPDNRIEIVWNHRQAYQELMDELAGSG